MTGEEKNLEWYHILLIAYAVIINIIAAVITVKDKNAAKHKKWRVPEKTLLTVAALSGCIVMYVTMHIIHHKTKHKLFIIGIPVIFVCELLAGIGLYGLLK